MPKHILVSDMDDEPTACLHGFWTDRPCERPARWRGKGANQWRACDEHRHPFDVPIVPVSKDDDYDDNWG